LKTFLSLWIVDLFTIYPIVWPKRVDRVFLGPPVILGETKGHFDGAVQRGRCGGGGYIQLNSQHSFHFRIGLGSGSNTRSELLALWTLLWLAIYKHIDILHVIGDSKVIIDWAVVINSTAYLRT